MCWNLRVTSSSSRNARKEKVRGESPSQVNRKWGAHMTPHRLGDGDSSLGKFLPGESSRMEEKEAGSGGGRRE